MEQRVKTKSFAWFAVGVMITIGVLGVVWAATSGDAEVRVNVRRLDDGRVEVGLQQHEDGQWASRQLPNLRFLGADAEAGRWFSSSPASVSVADSGAEVFSTEAQQISFFCIVTHEHPGDEEFWNIVRWAAVRFEALVGIPVEVKAGPEVAQQAALIRDCVADGADGIATTLPDAAGLKDALSEARAAGVSVVSFNSGLNDFDSVGSSRHFSVDEVVAGCEAGAQLNQSGTTGTVLCVVHEASNVGLTERCDGLEQGYPGEVERLSVADSGVSGISASTATIAQRLRAEDGQTVIAGIVTLNTQIGLAALDAITETGSDAVLATFDQNTEVLHAINRGEILFAVNTLPFDQSWQAMSQLVTLVPGEQRLRTRFGGQDPSVIIGSVAVSLRPRVFTKVNADAWIQVNQQMAEEVQAPE